LIGKDFQHQNRKLEHGMVCLAVTTAVAVAVPAAPSKEGGGGGGRKFNNASKECVWLDKGLGVDATA
jgi:hypothetical protein